MMIRAADYDVTLGDTGKMRLLDALIGRKLPVSIDAPDADAPDAFYPYPRISHSLSYNLRVT